MLEAETEVGTIKASSPADHYQLQLSRPYDDDDDDVDDDDDNIDDDDDDDQFDTKDSQSVPNDLLLMIVERETKTKTFLQLIWSCPMFLGPKKCCVFFANNSLVVIKLLCQTRAEAWRGMKRKRRMRTFG